MRHPHDPSLRMLTQNHSEVQDRQGLYQLEPVAQPKLCGALPENELFR